MDGPGNNGGFCSCLILFLVSQIQKITNNQSVKHTANKNIEN